ncbi:MAG: T9SS type A sorting domain-containing protein [Saprospirales bacterium]|nr:T9SS type A sorting domain-containing protein [Saprospirales bacterium]
MTISGDTGSWKLALDPVLFPFDSSLLFGPLPISIGTVLVVVVSVNDSLCTDTLLVTAPAPCSTPLPVCQTPISASVDSILCADNGTPLDSLDDTFTFLLTVSGGDSSWNIAGDSLAFPYDTAVVAGPFLISDSVVVLVLIDHADSLCTDTLTVFAPPPCSFPPVCQTPISAVADSVLCADNGTPQDSLDDIFTFFLTVSGGDSSWSIAGDSLAFPYDTAVQVGPYPIGGGPLTLVLLDLADTLCTDTVTITPPPPCSVPINACDVKEIGCIKYELLGIVVDSMQRKIYTIQVTNNCPNKMAYTAIQIPDGLVAKAPADNTTYTAPSGREYEVRNPNFSPFYSIRFKTMADSISGGQSDIFEYTLPAQADPTYIHVVTRVAPKIFYEAHLNVWDCDVTPSPLVITPSQLSPGPKLGPAVNPGVPGNPVPPVTGPQFTVYPNPTTGSGPVLVDLSDWAGLTVQLQLFNTYGKLLTDVSVVALDQPQPFDLPKGLDAGIYWLRLVPPVGPPQMQQFLIQW